MKVEAKIELIFKKKHEEIQNYGHVLDTYMNILRRNKFTIQQLQKILNSARK